MLCVPDAHTHTMLLGTSCQGGGARCTRAPSAMHARRTRACGMRSPCHAVHSPSLIRPAYAFTCMRCHHKYAHYISVKLGGAQWLDESRLRQLSAFAGWFSTYLSLYCPQNQSQTCGKLLGDANARRHFSGAEAGSSSGAEAGSSSGAGPSQP